MEILYVSLFLGSFVGLLAGVQMFVPVDINNPFLNWFKNYVINIAHAWVTVIHELGHWFWGLPSGLLALRPLPKIRIYDSHNATVQMTLVGGFLGWVLSPFYYFGGYLTPVLFGSLFLWAGLDESFQKDIPLIIIGVLSVVMFLGARNIKAFLYAFMPTLLWAALMFLMNTDGASGWVSAVYVFLGAVMFFGGLGDILAVNSWAVSPKKVRFFYGTDFGLATGWAGEHDGIGPEEKGWSVKPRGPFFFPHVALLIFDIIVILIVFFIVSFLLTLLFDFI